ncbi:MAG: histidine kinase [Chitinophagales bacterium]|nr:histidine kinase [Chitinophagales bacterium]
MPISDITSRSEIAQDKYMKQMKYMPYFLIIDFALIASALRYYLVPEWGWLHIVAFLSQCLVFTGFWFLIKFINRKLNNVFPFERGPFTRISLQVLITIVVVLPFIVAAVYFSREHIPDFVSDEFLATMMMMVLVVIFMFNFAFYAFHFFQHWQATVNEKSGLEIQAAELEREKYELQYHQLKNQVNPHYLFNMLTSLDGLVHTDPDLASDFIRHMAKVYRYVLQHKESEVVNLEDELEFIGHYIELLQIRYGQGLSIESKISEHARGKGIVMITLQMLLDNAIKHNIVQVSSPLNIKMWDEGDNLLIRNNKQLRKQIETSNGTGLQQLRQLYAFLTNKNIVVEDTPDYYTIRIPLI